jgi:hypothetical protein
MNELWYRKVGRRYEPVAHSERWEADVMKPGTWRMTYCYSSSAKRFSYDVTPDTASFEAACVLAAQAMEQAIADRSIARNSDQVPYTKRQLALIEKFRADMAAAGGLVPSWWQHSSARDIAQAGIDAVRNWGKPCAD